MFKVAVVPLLTRRSLESNWRPSPTMKELYKNATHKKKTVIDLRVGIRNGKSQCPERTYFFAA